MLDASAVSWPASAEGASCFALYNGRTLPPTGVCLIPCTPQCTSWIYDFSDLSGRRRWRRSCAVQSVRTALTGVAEICKRTVDAAQKVQKIWHGALTASARLNDHMT